MSIDMSSGWENVALQFASARSNIGVGTVQAWSEMLPAKAEIVDIGCGTGVPVAKSLSDAGFNVYGIDPSPTLIDLFRKNIPSAQAACETAQVSAFFNRQFDAALAIGVMFLLAEPVQTVIIRRMATIIRPGGHFLFTSPRQACEWTDSLTGHACRSLGRAAYTKMLKDAGFLLMPSITDEGENYYYSTVRALKGSWADTKL